MHKYPVRRSALSYYLNTYPSRIDFGKVQYGGPFTNEEVEDTKTVQRLSILLLNVLHVSLFGFHLSKLMMGFLLLITYLANPVHLH